MCDGFSNKKIDNKEKVGLHVFTEKKTGKEQRMMLNPAWQHDLLTVGEIELKNDNWFWFSEC